MDYFPKLIAALVLSFAGTAHAGYAQARPPAGWSPGTYATAANDSVYGSVIHSPNGPTTTAGGQAVKMPASYRLAANAPRIAAAVIFANPYVRVAAGVATWLGVGKLVYDAATGTWHEVNPLGDPGAGLLWRGTLVATRPGFDAWHTTQSVACGAVVNYRNSAQPAEYPKNVFTFLSVTNNNQCSYRRDFYDASMRLQSTSMPPPDVLVSKQNTNSSTCPQGWTSSPAGCLSPQLTQRQMVDLLNPANQPGWPMPETVPLELPPNTPLPVERPVINPEPGPNPVPRPRFVPTGNPVPNPNYDPNAAPGPNNQPYTQPGIRIVPSPTPSQPWRLDLQPVNRPQPDDMPKPNPDAESGTDPTEKPKPEEQQSLCEKHPDIVACARLGEPGQATPVPNETKTLTIAPENGFGPSGGSCPPPRTVGVAGLTLSMPFDLLCDFATGLKPVIVGLAWLTAAFTFMGIGRRS